MPLHPSNSDHYSYISRSCSSSYVSTSTIFNSSYLHLKTEKYCYSILYGATIGIGGAAGQFLGGFLVETNLFNLDWRLIFLVNVPIGIGTLIAALLLVHESKSEKPIRLDIGGAAIMSVVLFLLLYPLIEGRNAGWPLWMYAPIIVSIILIIPFIFFERRLLSSSEYNDNKQ